MEKKKEIIVHGIRFETVSLEKQVKCDKLKDLSGIGEWELEQKIDDCIDFLKGKRLMRDISVAQLEDCTGIDRRAIYQIENHQRIFGMKTFLKLCMAFDLYLGELNFFCSEDEEKDKSLHRISVCLKQMSMEDCYQLADYIEQHYAVKETQR